MSPIHNFQDADEIRKKAEQEHKLKQHKSALPLSEFDTLITIHELEVHQIELEMQKEQIANMAADALEAAEKYTNLFDFAPIGYFILDTTGTITSLNLMGANMLGKPRLHLENAKLGFFVSDGTKPLFNKMLESANNSHEKISAEVTLINSENQSMDVHLSCIANKAGMDCLVTAVDITERKLAEERLLQSEIKFRTVADYTYDWEYWKGIDDRFIYISPSCERITGYKPEEFMQNHLLLKSIIHPNDTEAYETHYQKAHSYSYNHNPEETEYRIIKKDGSIAYIGHICQHVLDSNGNNLGIRGSNRDITDRKQIEEIHNESEARFKTMFDKNYAVMLLIEPESGLILDANLAAENFYGYSMNELIGMNISKINKLSEEKIKSEMKEASNEDKNYFIFTHQLANGEERTVEVHSSPIDYRKKHILFSIIHDVSIRVKAEEEIKQKNLLLQKLNSDKNRFMHILAHDLRNPLLNITGFLALLKKNIRTYDIEKIEDYITTANNASKKMFALLEDILKWAFAHSDQSKFTPTQINLSSVCHEVVEISNISAAAKNLSISYAETANINVFADSDMLKAILRNLLTNAIKFSNQNGSINIKAEQTETEVIITVSDYGIGIAPEKLNNLFNLDQIHSTTGTEGERGTGLGLILCKEFVERHGGKIYVQSTVGKGSDFVFGLPNN